MFQITLTALVWLCIFNVSSNCLPLRMRGHIGCIYSTFPMFESPTGCTFSLLCVFKCLYKLPAGNQSIWEACPSDNLVAFIQFFPMFEITQVALDFDFFDSAFSNVSSNWLPLRMQSHIGCIYSTFPHVWKLLTWWICGIFLSRESINKSEDSHDTSLKANAENSCKQIGIL